MEHVSMDVEEEDGKFVKTEDLITIMNISDCGDTDSRYFLAGQGFGSSHCHLEPHPTNNDVADNLWKSTFKLEQSMSVHALYGRDKEQGVQMSVGRRIVLYGHAVLLRHIPTDKILCCQTSTSLSTNKLAYDVGFVDKSEVAVLENSCWFRVKPATKQRSEGEKVRTGDDVFLINVATERYLSAHQNNPDNKLVVQASFQQSLWAIHIMCCGSAKQDAIGYVNGGDVVRMIHRHSGVDCLTVAMKSCDSRHVGSNPSGDEDEVSICFESEAVHSQVRSLWRVELNKMRFGGQFTEWGQPFRLCHVVTGKYLGTSEECDKLTLLASKDAKKENTLFRFRQSLANLQWREGKEESMGTPQVKFGDSLVLLQHWHTRKWLGMNACDQIARGKVGQKTSRQALLFREGHLNFALTITRGLEQQIQAAVIMEVTDQTIRRFMDREFCALQKLDVVVVLQMKSNLQELLKYFEPVQKKRLSYHEKKRQLTILREKQNLFHNQGRLEFVASVIKRLPLLKLRASDTELIEVKHLLYQLLAAMIKGNKVNCSQFAPRSWTDLFIKELANPIFTHDILEILLHESAEVVEYLLEEHVNAIVNLLNTHGREEKVLQLLSSLCVCHGAAVRDKQKLTYDRLSKVDNLLLHPILHSRVYCYRSNIDLSSDVDGNVLAHRWYYEVTVTKVTPGKHHLRVGWIDVERFTPALGTFDEQLGSDCSSVGFDGSHVWAGGHSIEQYEVVNDGDLQPNSCVSAGNVFGCCLDTVDSRVCFTLNGVRIGSDIIMTHSSERYTVAISFSAGVEFKVAFGKARRPYGLLRYQPPLGYSPLSDVLVTELNSIILEPCVRVGDHVKLTFEGPQKLAPYMGFSPAAIDTTKVHLPQWVEAIEDRLAENIHDVWAESKIKHGWRYNEMRNNERKWHPMLRPYTSLTDDEKKYNRQISEETLKTLVALGYRLVRLSQEQASLAVKQLDPNSYQQSNGYLPRPLDLSVVDVPEDLMVLVNMLAENNHNVWAMQRIKEGWKYGSANDNDSRRNPALVPYTHLDEDTRDSNWNTACDVVRTVLLLGCSLEPTSMSRVQTASDLSLQETVVASDTRTFRGEYSYAMTKGRWYYEVKIKTPGMIRVGWTRPYLTAGTIVGTDQNSYSFDGHSACKWHVTGERFGKRWDVGNTVGCYLDLQERTMKFAVDGKMLYSGEEEAAFEGFEIGEGFVPAVTMAVGQEVTFHFGKEITGSDSLKYFKPGSGYVPLCKGMCDNIPIWYSTPCGRFEPITENYHPSLSVIRGDNNDEAQDNLTIMNKQHEDRSHHDHHQQKEAEQICLRLSMGLSFDLAQCQRIATPSSSKSQRTSFSIIIPAGQDTSLVYIGWTTQHFKYYSELFQKSSSSGGSMVGYQGFKVMDGSETCAEQVTGYMTCMASLFKSSSLTRLDSNNNNHVSSDYLIGCILDQNTGTISYTVNKEHISNCDIKISHSSKLFPTIVTTPTTETVATFKLFPQNDCIPFSHMILKSLVNGQCVPILPYRLKVLAYSKSYWSRVNYYTDHVQVTQQQGSYFGDIAMEVVKEEEMVSCIVPETEMRFNISDLLENEKLEKFYLDTLQLYCSISSHGNEKEADDIKKKLSKELLLKCLQLDGMPSTVRRGFYNLFSSLYLHSKVVSRLLTREERIIQLPPLIQTEFSIGPSVSTNSATMYNNSLAVLMANSLQALEPRKTFTLSHSISGKLTMHHPATEDGNDLIRLKEIVFSSLKRILKMGLLRCCTMTDERRADVIVPLLKMLDNLLVIGLIQEKDDIDQLLSILQGSEEDSEAFNGLLEEPLNEPIKLAVCELLQHLCDCQLQHRVEAIVKFAHEYTNDLKKEQESRFGSNQDDRLLLPKEFRTATEKQVKIMLQFVDGESAGDCPTSKLLRDRLSQFHHNLKVHCGLSQDIVDGDSQRMEEMNSKQIFSKIWRLLWSKDEGGIDSVDNANGVNELQQFVIRAMVKWSKEEIFDPNLISQIFSLLYRQYDEMNEVAKALGNTYVLDQPVASPDASGYDDVMRFRSDLAAVRMRLEVGIAFDEEVLSKALKNLSTNSLFSEHPELVRSLGIHQLVLQLLDTYLGIDSAARTSSDKHDAKKLKSRAKNKSINSAVKMCCTFLCMFSRVNADNQRALFPSIKKLLKYSEEHPNLTISTDYSLIKVATSAIKNNEELVFELTEGHFEHVIGLLSVITTNHSDSDSCDDPGTDFNALGVVILDGSEIKWSPKGAERLLDFLNASVCVAGKSVQENALIIIRHLIQRPECLGPALAGDDALGLQKVYDVVTCSKEDDSFNDNMSFSGSNASFSSSVLFSGDDLDIIILPFYNSLVKLLAWCSPDVERLQAAAVSNDKNDLRKSVQKNTHHILCSLISKEDILGVLALSFECGKALQPKHKGVVLQFLDKVYGFTDVGFLTDLISKSFTPDIKLALSPEDANFEDGFYSSLSYYLCMFVMPYLTKYVKCFHNSLKTDSFYIIRKWFVYSYELSCQPKLPKNFLPEIAKFLSTICVMLTPNLIHVLMPRFIVTVPDLKDNSIVALQYMSAHYSHFNRYYSLSGGWDVHGSASEEEKIMITIMLYRLLNALCEVVAKDAIGKDLLKQAVDCMQALVDSLSPEGLIPNTDKLFKMYEAKWVNYQPSPCDVSYAKMDSNMTLLAKLYAEHEHDTWVHSRMSNGWLYGTAFDEDRKRDPKMVDFDNLPQEDKDQYLIPATRTVQVLSVMGWKVMQQKVHVVSVDHKDPLICYWPRSKSVGSLSYVPSPIDLTNVYLNNNAYYVAEKLATEAHDYENVMKAKSNSVLTPYGLLSEGDKEKKREYFVNFIKVMKAYSYEVSRVGNVCSALPKMEYKSLSKCGIELLSHMLRQLTNVKGNMKLLVAVHCPLIHSYLCHYHDYFLPDISNYRNNSNNPPKLEEVLIVKLFCEMFAVCKSHLEEVVLRQSLKDDCVTTRSNIKVIVDCLTKMCAVLNPKIMSNHKESQYADDLKCFDRFLEEAGHSLSSLLNNISTLSPTHFEYNFKILIPSLSMFFQHFESHRCGRYIMLDEMLFDHCKTIFINLVKLSESISSSSDPTVFDMYKQELVNIGFCLGSFLFACPVIFLHGQGIGEMSLDSLISVLEKAVQPDTNYNIRCVAEVIIPMTFSYLCKWYKPPLPSRSSEGGSDSGEISLRDIKHSVQLTLSIIKNSLNDLNVIWMHNVSACVLPLIVECELTSVFYDVLKILRHLSSELYSNEVDLVSEEKNKDSKSKTATTTVLLRSRRTKLTEKYQMLCRNIYAILPLYLSYLDHHGTSTHSCENDLSVEHDAFMSYNCILTIFTNWYSSQIFRRELQTETVKLSRKLPYLVSPFGFPSGKVLMDQLNHSCPADRPPIKTNEPNILIKCAHAMLPLMESCYLDTFEKDTLDDGLDEYKRGAAEEKIKEDITKRLTGKSASNMGLFDRHFCEKKVDICLHLFDTKIKLLKIDSPVKRSSGKWKHFDLFRHRRKKAVIKCFLATSFYSLPMSRCVNLFLNCYKQLWLKKSINANLPLVKELTTQQCESVVQKKSLVYVNPLQQLLNAFCISSSVGQVFSSSLYISYCEVLSESCVGLVDDEEKYDEDDPTKNYELFARDRSRVRQKQNQLCDCGAADMVIDVLSCNAEYSPAVEATLKLGVSLLKGGNEKVQKYMFQKLKGMDAIFYRSIQSLISCCSALDWTAYERFNRAAPVDYDGDHTSNCHVLNDATFTHSLFRFLQLLCEGHNEDFQNNLRTQAGNTTTVNIVVHTVDYLLRLQESISDFYWHYSSYDAIDAQGTEIFFKAFRVAKQIFRTLTEFIQGPCIANQMTLANSRLWDATAGFLMVLAQLQKQLLQQSTQLELFRELVKVEKDLFILLLSMLEGNTVVSIACKMISTLVESSEHVEGMMKLYDMFMKLNDMVTSQAFKEYDLNKDGLISPSEFRKAMETLHIYSLEEIDYLMQCADTNKDGMLDYMEFTERFHTPAKNIGFSLCVLIANLSQRVPYDKGLEKLKTAGKGILCHFKDNIGKIEIMGKSGRMEKVYFEIESSRRRQWKDKQIVESRKHFLQTSEVGSSREKLESFINFCEDTIFEMEHIAKITDSENTMRMTQAEDHLTKHNPVTSNRRPSFLRHFYYTRFVKNRASLITTKAWSKLFPFIFLLSKTLIRSCTVCGKFLWCKCKLLWKVAHNYGRQSPTFTQASNAFRGITRKKRISLPKLPITVGPVQQDTVDGPISIERTPRNPQAIREKWLKDPSMNLSFDYARVQVKSPNAGASPSTSSTLTDDYQAASSNREHVPKIVYHKSFQARIARNYYRLQRTTLFVAFCINLLLLTAKYDEAMSLSDNQTVISHGSYHWVSLFISSLAISHFILSIMLFVAYGFLKVPLIICKCEKRAAHALQFRRLWTHVSPHGVTEHWDKLVIMSRHYPRRYFDKRVRHRVYEKLSCEEKVKCKNWIGGIVDDKPKEITSKWKQIMNLLNNIIDPYYTIWTVGVVISSPDVFYHVGFCLLSLLGVYWNYFYFSTHLIYLVTSFKLLRTVLKSVFNNWKQLLMTFLMTCIVIYLYTVIAFNFFRKFYVHKVDDDFKIMKCQSMFQCFLYHIDQGLRSGGGIADVLLPAVGDDYENLRLLFDVTFFFVVIVILLAIIQGLIIDSFGELREKEKSAREDMKTQIIEVVMYYYPMYLGPVLGILTESVKKPNVRKCYICGISKERFDQFPNGFENHTKNEHGMADYMYFLMYLISKPETEFSGQESYVWDHYIRRNWSFFPVGDCVQEQERRERERLKQNQIVVNS